MVLVVVLDSQVSILLLMLVIEVLLHVTGTVIGGLTCSLFEVVTVTACRQTCACSLLNAWFTAAAAWTPVRPRTPHCAHIQYARMEKPRFF